MAQQALNGTALLSTDAYAPRKMLKGLNGGPCRDRTYDQLIKRTTPLLITSCNFALSRALGRGLLLELPEMWPHEPALFANPRQTTIHAVPAIDQSKD